MRKYAVAVFLVSIGGVACAAVGQCPEELAKLLASDGVAGDEFGRSVSATDGGAVVGSRFDDDNGTNSGSAYVYHVTGSTWVEEAKLVASDGAAGDLFGRSVSISGDVAVVGARNDDNGNSSGSAYVYRFNGTTWIEEAKLVASDAAEGDDFGMSVSVSGDVVVVGAGLDDDNGADSGSAYVYRFNGSTWVEEAKLLASDGAEGDDFGISASVSGDVAVVGAENDDGAGVGHDSGSAYVYRFNGTTWIEEARLAASDAAPRDEFGFSVSVRGEVTIVGAWRNDDDGSNSGSAYVYRFNGSSWVEEAKLLASDGADRDNFGVSVSISGGVAVVGSRFDDDNGFNSGSAYVYLFNGATWIEETKFLASDGAADDEFGSSVSIGGDVAVVGALLEDDNGIDSGSAYVFDLECQSAETICPDDPDDFMRTFGGVVTGDALDLCASDDVRMDVLQTAQVSPLLPLIRLEFWAHSTLVDNPITSVDYTIEGHVSAVVSGGQNPDTLRTSIRNYNTGQFEIIDQRGTGENADETINHVQTTNAPDYVNAGDGEVRVKQDVFNPGNVVTLKWFLKVDLYEVVVNK